MNIALKSTLKKQQHPKVKGPCLIHNSGAAVLCLDFIFVVLNHLVH